jgi:squalene-associated FAD-dependent desaturase
MSSKNVIVIGGGLAGLAAGVALAESGWQVKLFEQRPYLGGRAASYELPNGEHVDNCQHVTFGCCTNLEDFYRRVGAAGKIKFFDRLVLQDPQGRRGDMHGGILPAPLHFTNSFLTFSPLALNDKLGIARAFTSILLSGGRPPEAIEQNMSMLDWLQRKKQTPAAIERFWKAVLVSALSEDLDKIDVRYGIDVFWKSVLANKKGYLMGVPTVALGELYDGCRLAIEKKGGELNFRSPMREIRIENGAVAAVLFDGGREERADAYVLALPHNTIADLLPPAAKELDPSLAGIDKITDASITGVHFWFDREVMKEPFLTLLETTTQWVFNKTALHHSPELSFRGPGLPEESAFSSARPSAEAAIPGAKQYLQLVISASHDLLQKPRQEIIDLCLAEVRHALPSARDAKLVKATVIKEAMAVFSPLPGIDRLRPPQQTKIGGLFLAGDWTATGWPATMEGAVRSGYLAGEAVLRSAGTNAKFLQPDLAPSGLSRLFA